MALNKQRLFLGSAFISVVLLYVYPLALGTPLLDPDEGLHASISQEMADSNDYVIPRSLGEPFRDKPILFFAAQAFSLRLFGMTEAAVRFPGLMFALFGVITTALLARRLFDHTTAIITTVVSLTLVVPLSLAQVAAHDVALVPWTNLLLLCMWEMEHGVSRVSRLAWSIGATIFVALAILTKGLIGIAVLAVGYALYAIVTRQLRWPLIARCTLILGGGVLLASPWYLAMENASPGYLHYYFIERHLLGYVTSTQHHGREVWYYYLPVMLFGAMPWTPYALPWVVRFRFSRQWLEDPEAKSGIYLICWLCGGVLFLSVAGSKLLTYALPLFPALAILVGAGIKLFFDGALSPAIQKTMAWTFRTLCVAGCVSPFVALVIFKRFFNAPSPPIAWLVVTLAASTTGAALILFQRKRIQEAFAVSSLWMALMFMAFFTWTFQAFAERTTQYELAQQLNAMTGAYDHLILVGEKPDSLVFYLRKDLREHFRKCGIRVMDPSMMMREASLQPRTIVAVAEGIAKSVDDELLRKVVTEGKIAGSYRVLAGRQPLSTANHVHGRTVK